MSLRLLLAAVFFLGWWGWTLRGDPPGAGRPGPQSERLFVIKRSLNANEVNYDIRYWPTGFEMNEPVRVYWSMKEDGGGYEELTGMETGRAYGIEVVEATRDRVVFTVKALPGRPITVRRLRVPGGSWNVVTTMAVNGRESTLEGIFIKTEGRGIFTKVKYIDVQGRTVADGKPTTERIHK